MTRQLLLMIPVLAAAVGSSSPAAGQNPAAPKGGVWHQRYDEGVDGKIKDTVREVPWQVTVKGGVITGTFKDKDGEHQFEGTIGAGAVPLVRLRQVDPRSKEWERHYVGWYKDGRITGTWYQNDGVSGDFEFVPGKKK